MRNSRQSLANPGTADTGGRPYWCGGMKTANHHRERELQMILWRVILPVALLMAGCATRPIPGADPDLLGFLGQNEVTREEVILKLGQPSAVFEREHILTYRIGREKRQGYYVGYYVISPRDTMPWQHVRYSLVLVFDERGHLEKHKLIPVE